MLENEQENALSRGLHKLQMRWALVAVRSSRALIQESDQKEQKHLRSWLLLSEKDKVKMKAPKGFKSKSQSVEKKSCLCKVRTAYGARVARPCATKKDGRLISIATFEACRVESARAVSCARTLPRYDDDAAD